MSPPRGFAAPPLFPDDPPADRRGDAPTSAAAWAKIKVHRRESYEQIMAVVRGRGRFGATVKELAGILGKVPSDISGRLTELVDARELQLLRDADGKAVRRNGCRVLTAAE